LFNAGDAAGRALAGLHKQAISSTTLFTYCGARTLICLGIALCNVVPSKPWLLPALMWWVSCTHHPILPLLIIPQFDYAFSHTRQFSSFFHASLKRVEEVL